jgi:hypothetical protein
MDVVTQDELVEVARQLLEWDLAEQEARTGLSLTTARISGGASLEPGALVWDRRRGLCVDPEAGGTDAPFFAKSPEMMSYLRGEKRQTWSDRHVTLRQRLVLWVWIAVITAITIFPPWTARGGYAMRYGFIFAPPSSAAHVDESRLWPEWIAATVICGGLFLAWPTRSKPSY